MIRRTVPTDEGGKYYYDPEAAEAGYQFFCQRLTLTIGEWSGVPFIPSKEQEQIIRDVFGWKRTDDGTRRYRVVFIWVPRKWGKSEFAAGLGLLMLVGDNEPSAEVYCIATTEDQARIIYDRAVNMVLADNDSRAERDGNEGPYLADAITPFKKNIWYHETGSKIEVLTGKPTGKHGLVTSGILADEVHEWPDDELYVFVHQAEGNRRQPLDVFTSTSGKKKGPGWEYYKLCEAILDGSVIDPTTYVFIASADPVKHAEDTEYWTTEEAWAEANPNYPVTPKKSYLEAECNKAKGSPRLQNNFLRYHLNLWVEQDTRWFDMGRWDKCAVSDWRTMAERMRGRPCVGGVDLSAVSDLTCRSLVFPPIEDDPWVEVVMSDGSVARLKRWFVLPRFFIPRGRLEERVKLDKQPFDKWLKAGAVDATPGDVIDQNALHKLTLEDAEQYDLRAVMVDRWNATQFVVNLRDEGIEAQMFGQGFGSMSGPSKWLERAVLLQQIDHGGHPVLRWCASNVAVVEDHAENIKPSKDESSDRIDGIVATIMAVGGCDEFLGDEDPDGQIVEVDFGHIRGS